MPDFAFFQITQGDYQMLVVDEHCYRTLASMSMSPEPKVYVARHSIQYLKYHMSKPLGLAITD